jgi:Zn-dependent peptidase ImmA (M78 family)
MVVRKATVSSKAMELLKSAKVTKLPVDVEQLAIFCGAEVRYEPFTGELSGMLRRQHSGKHVIGVNATHSVARQRFTIAHELGHLQLHKDEEFHVDETPPIRFRRDSASPAVDSDEIEANYFAAELLMPAKWLENEIEEIPPGVEPEEAVAHLADIFGVSVQAMTIRLSSLGKLS